MSPGAPRRRARRAAAAGTRRRTGCTRRSRRAGSGPPAARGVRSPPSHHLGRSPWPSEGPACQAARAPVLACRSSRLGERQPASCSLGPRRRRRLLLSRNVRGAELDARPCRVLACSCPAVCVRDSRPSPSLDAQPLGGEAPQPTARSASVAPGSTSRSRRRAVRPLATSRSASSPPASTFTPPRDPRGAARRREALGWLPLLDPSGFLALEQATDTVVVWKPRSDQFRLQPASDLWRQTLTARFFAPTAASRRGRRRRWTRSPTPASRSSS